MPYQEESVESKLLVEKRNNSSQKSFSVSEHRNFEVFSR
jgi:hypothetical protein